MIVNILTKFGLPKDYGPLKLSLKNKEQNDGDDVIADVIPIAMGNAQGS